MTTGSYLEHYLTLLAWVINNGIWNTLVSTGLFAASLGAIILSEWLDARTQGADEGNKGVLSTLRVENRLYVAYLVIIFACVPLLPLDITHLKFDKTRSQECGVNVADPKQTGWGKAFDNIGNQSGKVPVWWALVHALSKGVTASATAAIPCYPDIRSVKMEVDESQIPSRSLVDEVNAFAEQCYTAARVLLKGTNKADLSTKEDKDTGWIGSQYFLEQEGYYNKLQAQTAQTNWPYTESRDSALFKHTSGPLLGAGYPYCKNWWSDADIGLRARLKKAIKPELWTRIKKSFRWISEEKAEEETLRLLVRPSHMYRTNDIEEIIDWNNSLYANTADNSRGESDFAKGIAAKVGAALSGFGYFPSMYALRTALPMIQAFLMMGIIISLPLIIVLSTYSLKVVMMTSFGLFTLHMLTFWWELARWIDSSLVHTLYDGYESSFAFASLDQQVLMLVNSALFLLLPGLFFVAMSWAGYALGRGMDGMLGNASSGAKQAGSTGGNVAGSMIKTVATRGMSKGK